MSVPDLDDLLDERSGTMSEAINAINADRLSPRRHCEGVISMARSQSSVTRMRAAAKLWQQANPDKVKAQQQRYYQDNKERLRAYSREYKQSERGRVVTKEYATTYNRAYRETHRSERIAGHRTYRKRHARRLAITTMMRKYGLSQADAERMFNQKTCDLCGACGRRMHTDHDHKTGVVRGRLCGPCNQGLGLLHEDIDVLTKAIAYLRRADSNGSNA